MRKPPPPISEEDRRLFASAVGGVRPLPPPGRVHQPPPAAAPVPRQRLADERAALDESLHGPLAIEDRLEGGDEPTHLRAGLPRTVLRDLRHGRWVIEAELDLHGATRDEAREHVARFVGECLREDRRCVRIIHGRGLRSPGRVGLLKTLVRGWLAQRCEVLAYCQAKPQDGGEGALIALLSGKQRSGSQR